MTPNEIVLACMLGCFMGYCLWLSRKADDLTEDLDRANEYLQNARSREERSHEKARQLHQENCILSIKICRLQEVLDVPR